MSAQGSSLPQGRYAALLFDMDGTILNSIAAAERIWRAWATRHGLDVATFLPTIHGARAIDTIRRLALPGVDAESEAEGITGAEIDDVEGVVSIPGAVKLLNSLPATKWAVVTSAPKALAIRRMQAAGISAPPLLITSEDVAIGKPHPDGYLLAARKLGVDIANCLILEDAAVGIAAAEAAGATVLVVTATHLHRLHTAHATIRNYQGIVAKLDKDGLMQLEQQDI